LINKNKIIAFTDENPKRRYNGFINKTITTFGKGTGYSGLTDDKGNALPPDIGEVAWQV